MALVTELDTPAVTVRLDIVERNIRRGTNTSQATASPIVRT
jgi:D-serine deaminase-like pyridoxal phosphate-dependent protein